MTYSAIPGTSTIASTTLALDDCVQKIPESLENPNPPTVGSKSIFAFWHSGLHSLPPYLLRNVLNWHRRFSSTGWTIYVLNTIDGSRLNVSNFIDTASSENVPEAFQKHTLNGTYAAQHTSDLIRYPLLLKYGGVYLDVGILQFGDIDWLWTNHIVNPDSQFDFAGFTMGDPPAGISIVNFAFMCGPGNPLVRRAHHILLKLWEGKKNTTGMHQHPLVNHLELMHVPQEVAVDDEGQDKMVINDAVMTDYAIQIQCMAAAQRWFDVEAAWDGPKYTRERCWLYSMMDGAFAHEQVTSWSGQRQYDLLRQKIPVDEAIESDDQVFARKMIQNSIANSWCLKLGHGFSAKLFGADTLGMLWRKNDGSDCEEGTYAGWLRWAEVHCKQDNVPKPLDIPVFEPTMRGRLL
ncbi:hypothetical protein BKA66DRAFT_471944 [Pyrenochaeta sp. MPI-SDFR-AT-0127]|nr:hypothetical protein BKA66DRAFT_471944 [Pyrenochaeta sp. MPI-SDFR-AT-0127]